MAIPPTLQKAWYYAEYGDLDRLKLRNDAIVPKPGPGELLLKIHAAALNPADFKRRHGFFGSNDSPLPVSELCWLHLSLLQHVPGFDVAGEVVALGEGVSGEWKVGDAVYGDLSEHAVNKPRQFGSLAQYTAVEEKLLARKPVNLSFAEAASLPLALLTANQRFEHAHFRPGQTVLILGGAGGIGSLAIQLAKVVHDASFVATTVSTKKIDFAKSLGADHVIDYTTTKYYELPQKYDFIFDTVGDSENAAKVVKEGGHVLTIVDYQAKPAVTFYALVSNGAALSNLNPYFESGKLKPIIDPNGPFSFLQVKEAFTYLETGRATGKVVIAPVD